MILSVVLFELLVVERPFVVHDKGVGYTKSSNDVLMDERLDVPLGNRGKYLSLNPFSKVVNTYHNKSVIPYCR